MKNDHGGEHMPISGRSKNLEGEHMTEVEPVIIKRYANRKLYDTRASRYITLSKIARLIEKGDRVSIIDMESGKDITEMTLAQVFVDRRRKRPGAPPLDGLRDAFQNASEQVMRQLTEPVTSIRTNFELSVNKLLKSGEEKAQITKDTLQNWLNEQNHAIEDAQKRLEERFSALARRLDDIRDLKKRIEELEEKVRTLTEGKIKKPQGERDR